jgi:hypothetical protein
MKIYVEEKKVLQDTVLWSWWISEVDDYDYVLWSWWISVVDDYDPGEFRRWWMMTNNQMKIYVEEKVVLQDTVLWSWWISEVVDEKQPDEDIRRTESSVAGYCIISYKL